MDLESEIKSEVWNRFQRGLTDEMKRGLDQACWQEIDRCFQDSFGLGFKDRLQTQRKTLAGWWNGEGKGYSQKRVDDFLHRVNAIQGRPTPDRIRREYDTLKKEQRVAVKRLNEQKAIQFAPILCDD